MGNPKLKFPVRFKLSFRFTGLVTRTRLLFTDCELVTAFVEYPAMMKAKKFTNLAGSKLRDYLKEDPAVEIITIKGVGYHFAVGKSV